MPETARAGTARWNRRTGAEPRARSREGPGVPDPRQHHRPEHLPVLLGGCATLVHVKGGEIINIEGDPRSPHNEGTLCPKGAAIFQLHKNPNRPTKVMHRKPGATNWEPMGLEEALDRVAKLVSQTRDETFIERLGDGKAVMTPAIFALGGATMDNEWNHLAQKLCRGLLGIVTIENQARI